MWIDRGQDLSRCTADVTSLLTQIQAHWSGGKTLARTIDIHDAEMVSMAGDEVKVSVQSMKFLMNWEIVEQSPSFRKSADSNEAALKVVHGKYKYMHVVSQVTWINTTFT